MEQEKIYIKVGLGAGEIPAGTPLREALGSVPDEVVGAEYNGRLLGLEDPISDSGEYRLVTIRSPRARELLWHTASHLLAQAVLRLYPHAKLGIGPPIRDGFYYDFDFGTPISSDDLNRIEEEMRREVEENYPVYRREISREEALRLFREKGQDFKVELILELDGAISTYTQGEFTDLCKGPHLPYTGLVKHFKLLSLTGAYWRGDERNPMLQRIYGTAYFTQEELDEHLRRLEEAKKRDHRLLGKQLRLFSFHPEAPGTPFWHPRGVVIFNTIAQFWREIHERSGYQEIRTPIILAQELWERSGHWEHYRNNMYFTSQENQMFAVKPMNCPGAVLMYTERQWSYRDLPWRASELGIVHRYEKSGVLHGLFRVRAFNLDDAHIFCTPDQLVDEIEQVVRLIKEIYSRFGLTQVEVELSTRPPKRIGSDEVWDRAEEALQVALQREGMPFTINEGEGAFYGPKIDFHITDSLGRSWQCGTVQVDFSFPERFGLEYIGPDNQPHRPVMVHRAIFGSLERFIGILVEHFGGDFPLWLAPEQVRILPVTDSNLPYAHSLRENLIERGIRAEVDERSEKVGRKVRDAEVDRVPYMLIVGAREMESGTISVRRKGLGDLGVQTVEHFITQIEREIKEKWLPPHLHPTSIANSSV